MKPIHTLLLLSASLFTLAIQAQQEIGHLQDLNQHVSPRYGGADSIVVRKYSNGENISENYNLIRRDPTGLIDTIYFYNYFVPVIQKYSPENRLLVSQTGHSGEEKQYMYDQKGRYRSIARFTKDQPTQTIEYLYLDDQIEYTDSSYLLSEVRISKVDATIIGQDTMVCEYVFDPQKRLIRDNLQTYTYQEDGGVVMTIHSGLTMDETTLYYGRDHLLYKTIECAFWNSARCTTTEYTYYQNHQPLAVETLTTHEETPVWGTHGGIRTTVDTPQIIQIYTLTGRLVTQTHIQPYETLPLAPGLYIVTLPKRSYKIVVQ